MSQCICFLLGMIAAMFFPFYHRPHILHLEEDGSLVYSSDDHLRTLESINSVKPVILISISAYSVTQISYLVRLAQAVYPARSFVKWIIVALPVSTFPEADYLFEEADNMTFEEYVSRNPDLELDHVQRLSSLVSRFGVDVVVLDFLDLPGWEWGQTVELYERANLRGLEWAMANLPRGKVIALGKGSDAVNFRLFSELYSAASSNLAWPVANLPYSFSNVSHFLSVPVAEENSVHLYATLKAGSFIHSWLLPGGFAVDLAFLKKQRCSIKHIYINQCGQLRLDNFQVISSKAIYMWRITGYYTDFPDKIKANITNVESNLNTLLENSLGPWYEFVSGFLLEISPNDYREKRHRRFSSRLAYFGVL